MNRQKIENVLLLDDLERLEYFIRKVADFEELWGAYEEGWLLLGDNSDKKFLPVWPEEDFAKNYIDENKAIALPKRIELGHFFEKWLPGMENDGTDILVFPIKGSQGVVLPPSVLNEKLKEEMQQYD
ncbi:DUF2750 domain-containing protein [Pseudomonas sp. CDFA 602]|uniref:DUF2750 domain-containing protein n=1 Tax=Pseudomonas californiensis TaxID=2829823 RepID=UPI001E54C812|nr:DUF2750 domain-containing protein [Pseudomonas californiensis]MCD5995955.1 DUF2750 domain-containing protein [Pseudomonas californiensis]MCD6001604.1 DUF2750 domain-containing protein [Pseudomonas californiensis]